MGCIRYLGTTWYGESVKVEELKIGVIQISVNNTPVHIIKAKEARVVLVGKEFIETLKTNYADIEGKVVDIQCRNSVYVKGIITQGLKADRLKYGSIVSFDEDCIPDLLKEIKTRKKIEKRISKPKEAKRKEIRIHIYGYFTEIESEIPVRFTGSINKLIANNLVNIEGIVQNVFAVNIIRTSYINTSTNINDTWVFRNE